VTNYDAEIINNGLNVRTATNGNDFGSPTEFKFVEVPELNAG